MGDKTATGHANGGSHVIADDRSYRTADLTIDYQLRVRAKRRGSPLW